MLLFDGSSYQLLASYWIMQRLRYLLQILIAFTLISCGGGGGGGSNPNEPATVPAYSNLDVQPTTLDAGDKLVTTIYLQQINKDGILLKIRVPLSVLYYNATGRLTVDGVEQYIRPEFYQADTTYNYLVYILSPSQFGQSNEGAVTVQFQTTAAVAAGTVDVDVDFRDPSIANAVQFDVNNPLFTPANSVKIVVKNG